MQKTKSTSHYSKILMSKIWIYKHGYNPPSQGCILEVLEASVSTVMSTILIQGARACAEAGPSAQARIQGEDRIENYK